MRKQDGNDDGQAAGSVVALEGGSAPAEIPAALAIEEVSDEEIHRLVLELDEQLKEEAELEAPTVRHQYDSVEALLAIEEKAREGIWRAWPAVRDGEVLICDPGEAIQEESRLVKKYQLERAVKAKDFAKGFGDPVPQQVERLFQAKARFGRSVRGFRGAAFEGLPFNWQNFLKLWTKSAAFRMFVNLESGLVRSLLDQEAADLGKG